MVTMLSGLLLLSGVPEAQWMKRLPTSGPGFELCSRRNRLTVNGGFSLSFAH